MKLLRQIKPISIFWMSVLLLLGLSITAAAQSTSYSIINTFAGGGEEGVPLPLSGSGAKLAHDNLGNIYFADQNNNRVFKISTNGNASLFAGNGTASYSNGTLAILSGLPSPTGIACDAAGNVYISLSSMDIVVKVSASTSIVTTIAGTGIGGTTGNGGPATAAQINNPHGLSIDPSGNLYIMELNHDVRKVNLSTGIITRVAGDGFYDPYAPYVDGVPATSASLGIEHQDVATDAAGNLYIPCKFFGPFNRILKVTAATGIINSIAGDSTATYSGDGGPATAAGFSFPKSIAVDQAGNMYFDDDNRIRKIDAVTGIITTIAGTGIVGNTGDGGLATAAQITTVFPIGLMVDATNNYLYFTQPNVPRIRRINLTTSIISSFATTSAAINGDGGQATSAYFAPVIRDVAVAQNGDVYIADGVARVRKVDHTTNIITTIAGTSAGFGGDNGSALNALLSDPAGMALDNTGNMYIADRNNNRVRKVDAVTNIITTVAGNGTAGTPLEGAQATATTLSAPNDIAVDAAGNFYISPAPLHAIYKVTAATGVITKVAGNGIAGFSGDNGAATIAQITSPHGILLDAAGNLVFCDRGNHRIRKINLTTGIITTIAGTGVAGAADGPALSAQFSSPDDLAYDPAGNLIIADLGNNKMRLLAPNGNVYTVAGTGLPTFSGDGGQSTAARLNQPDGMAIAPDGKTYIADQLNSRVRTFTSPVIVQPATVKLRLKVLLQGALLGNIPAEATTMRDNLRSSPFVAGTNYIPTTDPYSTAPLSASFAEVGDGLNLGYRTVASPATMFADQGTSSLVDWVFVELRDKNNPATVLGTRSVLVRRNGLTVDALGDDTLRFPSLLANDQYYVSVRHRNHMGAMTATALPVGTFDGSTVIDFTAMTNAQLWNSPGYDGLEQATVSPGVKALWAGNTNADTRIRFSGVGNDVGGIQSAVQTFLANTSQSLAYTLAHGYFSGDVNMDSKDRFSGVGNDPAWVQSLIQNYINNATQSLVYTSFLQQLP